MMIQGREVRARRGKIRRAREKIGTILGAHDRNGKKDNGVSDHFLTTLDPLQHRKCNLEGIDVGIRDNYSMYMKLILFT